MRAAIFDSRSSTPGNWVSIEDLPRPELKPEDVLLKVLACGVCRTDLHLVEGDLPPIRLRIIPGHQIVGEVVEGPTTNLSIGMRVGVSWMGGVDGNCWFCRHEMENLCDNPVFTGYSVNGGYAEYASVRADFAIPLSPSLEAFQVAPLLCAGIIGFRSLRVAGVQRGERVGLYGFGSSASLAIRILQAWDCEVYVVTRGWATRMHSRRSSLIVPSRSLPVARSSSALCLPFEKAEWSPLTPFTLIGCLPSTTTSFSGVSARSAAWLM